MSITTPENKMEFDVCVAPATRPEGPGLCNIGVVLQYIRWLRETNRVGRLLEQCGERGPTTRRRRRAKKKCKPRAPRSSRRHQPMQVLPQNRVSVDTQRCRRVWWRSRDESIVIANRDSWPSTSNDDDDGDGASAEARRPKMTTASQTLMPSPYQ